MNSEKQSDRSATPARRLTLNSATKAREFLNLAIDHGHAVSWVPGMASGTDAYVTVNVQLPDRSKLRVTWHTRTGLWRFSGAIVNATGRWHDLTLTESQMLVSRQ